LSFDLKMLIVWGFAVVSAVVFACMFYIMFAHRRSKRVSAAHFHNNIGVEMLWTLVPMLILVGMSMPAVHNLIESSDTQQHNTTLRDLRAQGITGVMITPDAMMIDFFRKIDDTRVGQWSLLIFGEGDCGLGCEKFLAELRIFTTKSQEARGKLSVRYLSNRSSRRNDIPEFLSRALPEMSAAAATFSDFKSPFLDEVSFRVTDHLVGILVSPDKSTVLFYNFQVGEKNLLEDLARLLRG
jgi:hypothetical protein